MVIRKKWASPKKSTPVKSRRRSISRGPSSLSVGAKKIGGGLSANIKVAVRVRPENEREQAGSYDNVIKCVDKNMLIFDPKDCEQTFFFKGKKQTMRDLNKKQKKDKTFTFDNVYDEDSTNEEVFEGTTKSIVNTLFDGYNCCVFAYGATGAGKTHTMLGNQNNPGITFLTMKEIFARVEATEDVNFDVFLSYIEVYNENIRDLMEPSKSLIIREDGKSGTTINGMTMLKPKSPDEVLSLLSMGNNNRTQHPTDHNKESSRSHAILQIIVQQKPKDAGLSAEVKTAKLSMIDLAGSEKGSATGHKGERFREGSNINKSLLALGNCINALAAGSKYIPYRDSKLTRLLKDSVGGNCATVMIANISPSSLSYEDTLNTLKYADRAKQIKVDLKKNVVNVEFHVAQYAKIVEDLRSEIDSLKHKIKNLEEENEKLKDSGGCPVQAADLADSCPAPSASNIADRLTAASVGQAEIDMENLDSLSTITKLRQQLNVLIQREKKYDQLQEREANLQREQAQTRKENDALKSNMARLKHQMTSMQEKSIKENTDSTLEELISSRDQTLEEIGNERSRLSTLKLRVHYKVLQAERCNLFGVGGIEKERSEAKMSKTIEALNKKVEKKKERLNALLQKFNEQNKNIQDQMSKNSASLTAISAEPRLSLEEHKTENILLHCVVSSMERELNRLHRDFTQIIPYLIRNEKLLRGHGISSQEDKDKFSELQALLLSSEDIAFAVNTSVNEELEQSVFKQCSTLNLPSLSYTRRKSSSLEQKIFASDTMMEATQEDTGFDETDSCVNSKVDGHQVHGSKHVVGHDISAGFSDSGQVCADLSTESSETMQVVKEKVNGGDETFPASDKKQVLMPAVENVATESPLKAIHFVEAIREKTESNKVTEVVKPNSVKDKINEILNGDEIPPTPVLTRQNSGSVAPPPGVEPRNKSFLDRLPIARHNKGESNVVSGSASNNLNSTITITDSPNSDRLEVDSPLASTDRQPTGPLPRETVTSTVLPREVVTAKRNFIDARMECSLESPSKKLRLLNETYNHDAASDGPSAWLTHRRVNAIPDSPLVLGQLAASPATSTVSLADSTFTKDEETPSPKSSPPKLQVKEGESDLGTELTAGHKLLSQLDIKCTGQTASSGTTVMASVPKGAVKSADLNSTFPVEDANEEPMEIDPTVNLNDISVISSPVKKESNLLSVLNKSPIKAKMGSSPKYAAKRNTPSPLRESTLIDMKPRRPGDPTKKPSTTGDDPATTSKTGFNRPATNQQTVQSTNKQTASVNKAINKLKILSSTKGKRTLNSSKSTSSLLRDSKPAAAHKLNLPPYPSTSGGVGRGRSPGRHVRTPGSPTYLQATLASNNKSATLDRKPKGTENQKPGSQVKTGTGTGLKRSASSVGRPRF